MTVPTLTLVPDQAGYSLDSPVDVLTAILDGGAPRFRLDKIGSWHRVNVQWTCDGSDYDYLQQAYRYLTYNGNVMFEMDLILFTQTLTRVNAVFVPGSLKLAGVAGSSYVVTAVIWVEPPTLDDPLSFPAFGGIGVYFGFLNSITAIPAQSANILALENQKKSQYAGTYTLHQDGVLDRYMTFAIPDTWGTPANFIIQGFNYTLDVSSVTLNGVLYKVFFNDNATAVTSLTLQVQ